MLEKERNQILNCIGFKEPNQTHLPEPNNSKVNQHKNETLFQMKQK